jgi:tetratricopeptide (TPR) repeat protein
MNALSLVMIVRNEADVLPEFLAHHSDLAGEIIVVDTGSTDDSVRLARAGGAQVIQQTWADDFSWARNTGLDAARGDWILILDADEMIDRADFQAVRQLVDQSAPQVMVQETINYCADPTHLEWRPVTGRYPTREAGYGGYFAARRAGLFPNRPGLRFSGRIHESILPAAEQAGLPVVDVAVPVHHYGYVRSPEVDAGRKERYLRLAELKHAEDPDDWSALLELATAHLETGSVDEAISLLQQLVVGPAGLRPVVRGLFLLSRIRREEGALEEAGELSRRAVDQDPGFLFGWLELIRCHAVAERWLQVGELLDQAMEGFGPDDPLLTKENLRFLLKTGQLEAAVSEAEKLERQFPHWREIAALSGRLKQVANQRKSTEER